MNWSINCLQGAVFTALFFIFFSCNEVKKVGNEIQPETIKFHITHIDTFNVDAYTIYFKNVNTRISSFTLFGNYEDPSIGKFSVEGYSMLDNVKDNLSFELGAEYDSLVLYFVGFPYYYGDTTQFFDLKVYRLEQPLDTHNIYNSTTRLQKSDNPIGVARFKPFTHKRDTIKIRLSDEIGKMIFEKGGLPELANHYNFNKLLRGLAFTSSSNGCILGFYNSNPKGLADRAFIRLYYSVTENNVKKRRFQTFNFSSRNLCFNFIHSDFNGLLSNLRINKDTLQSSLADNRTYIQGSTALFTILNFKGLTSLKSLKNKILINKAEIYLKVDETLFFSNNIKHNPPSISIYFPDKYNDLVEKEDGTLKTVTIRGSTSLGKVIAFYNQDLKSYSINVTDYIQDFIYGRENSIRFLLSPSNWASTMDRLILSNPSDNIKLKLYYTLL